jgi:hypothetical protein
MMNANMTEPRCLIAVFIGHPGFRTSSPTQENGFADLPNVSSPQTDETVYAIANCGQSVGLWSLAST